MTADTHPVQRRHTMPFGAEPTPHGVRFRLWAPGAQTVDLALEATGGPVFAPMMATADGWFELVSPAAQVGSHYRFRIDGDLLVPDPASRSQAEDVHGPSVVVDPHAFAWQDGDWQGRPWHETVLYELHTGTCTTGGRFLDLVERLDHLVDLGVTAIELMPVADFPGSRNWGYDGVLLFAPDRSYGTPEELKTLVQEAHRRGLMVFLDVVYNHFGPEGNYLYVYARDGFFNEERHTPWGAAINFDGDPAAIVRRFYVDNALYWLEEFHLDGLRLDAVHAILDTSAPHILEEIAQAVRTGPGRERHVHLILENDRNQARYLTGAHDAAKPGYDAQWNDDIHHCGHVLLTGEQEGYYRDYAAEPLHLLGRCLTEGFAYQGEPSPFQQGHRRGEPSAHLPLTRFVSFLQNHDQVGNRAFGERLVQLAPEPLLRALTALLLLAPAPPLLFMGEEFGATTPFLYFCDFGADLADSVRDGRRREFGRFAAFADPDIRALIPDPNEIATWQRSRLDWQEAAEPRGLAWLQFYRELLTLRHREIVPRLGGLVTNRSDCTLIGPGALRVRWQLADASCLEALINTSAMTLAVDPRPEGTLLYSLPARERTGIGPAVLEPFSLRLFLTTTKDSR